MAPSDAHHCYLVRTDPDLVEKGIVGVGWSMLDFTSLPDAEAAIQTIKGCYDLGKRANQVRRFYQIQEGDLIVVPLAGHVAIGRAIGSLFFDAK